MFEIIETKYVDSRFDYIQHNLNFVRRFFNTFENFSISVLLLKKHTALFLGLDDMTYMPRYNYDGINVHI